MKFYSTFGWSFFLEDVHCFCWIFFFFWGNFCCWNWRQKNPLKPYSSGISKVISFCCLFRSFILFISLFFAQMEFGECVQFVREGKMGSGGLEERAGYMSPKTAIFKLAVANARLLFTNMSSFVPFYYKTSPPHRAFLHFVEC